jgi:hypothetical protein
MKCDKCGSESPVGARFCVVCGSQLAQACPVCREPVALGQPFCAHCGAEVKSSISGLPIDRALVWKDLFQRSGWWSFEVPDELAGVRVGKFGSQKQIEPVVMALMEQNDGPLNPSSEKEPWIFISAVAPRPFHIEELRVFGEKWKTLIYPQVVIATRCRLVVARTRADPPLLSARPMPCEAYQWYYRNLVKWDRSKEQLRLVFGEGRGFTGMRHQKEEKLLDVKPVKCDGIQTVDLKLQTGGRGLINQAAWIFGDRDSTRLVAASNMASRDEFNAGFLDTIDKFCSEIADCRAKKV